MKREEVYSKCVKPLPEIGEGVVQRILPDEAIDAIIDCAVEEAIKAVMEMKGVTDVSRQESKAFTMDITEVPFMMGIAEGCRGACDDMLEYRGEQE